MADNAATQDRIQIKPKGTQEFINDLNVNFTTLFNYFSGGGVSEDAIRNGAVSTEKIQDGAVNNLKLSGDNDDSKDLNRAVSADKIRNGAVSTKKIEDGAVTNAKIESGTITSDKLNQAQFKQMLRDLVYPTGSIYISYDKKFNPNTAFGGSWEQITDRFLWMANVNGTDSANKMGGSSTVVLTGHNLPNHTHTASYSGEHNHTSYGGHSSLPSGNQYAHIQATDSTWRFQSIKGLTTSSSGIHTHTITGGGLDNPTPISIMPPYIHVYAWRRTA